MKILSFWISSFRYLYTVRAWGWDRCRYGGLCRNDLHTLFSFYPAAWSGTNRKATQLSIHLPPPKSSILRPQESKNLSCWPLSKVPSLSGFPPRTSIRSAAVPVLRVTTGAPLPLSFYLEDRSTYENARLSGGGRSTARLSAPRHRGTSHRTRHTNRSRLWPRNAA